MTSKQHNRGSWAIRASFDRDLKRREALAGRNFDRALDEINEELTEQAAEIQALRDEMELTKTLLKSRDDEIAALKADLDHSEKGRQNLRTLVNTFRARMEFCEEKHHILSQVIRLGMAPDYYLALRKSIEEDKNDL